MMDPAGFASKYAKNWSIPSHIVLFESEENLLKDFLVSHSYREVYFWDPFRIKSIAPVEIWIGDFNYW